MGECEAQADKLREAAEKRYFLYGRAEKCKFFSQNKKKCLECSETKENAKYFMTFLLGNSLKA